ncbi:DUF3422 family protein [Cupriavidus basilensis]
MALAGTAGRSRPGRKPDELQRALGPLMHSMDASPGPQHDAELLVRLTHLAVRIEALAESGGRFSASRAYEENSCSLPDS